MRRSTVLSLSPQIAFPANKKESSIKLLLRVTHTHTHTHTRTHMITFFNIEIRTYLKIKKNEISKRILS